MTSADARAVITAVSCKVGKDEFPLKENIDKAVSNASIVVLVSAKREFEGHEQYINLEEVSHNTFVV